MVKDKIIRITLNDIEDFENKGGDIVRISLEEIESFYNRSPDTDINSEVFLTETLVLVCKFCHLEVGNDGRSWGICKKCGFAHHLDCWEKDKRCANCGSPCFEAKEII